MNQSDEETQEGRLSFFTDPSNWPLFYHTAKNMKARQLVGIAERKARHAIIPRLPIDFDQRYEQRIPDELVVTPRPISENSGTLRDSLSKSERERYQQRVNDATDGKLTFLNRSINFGDEIDWNHEQLDEFPLLWRLKLQSFEFLEWAILGFEDPSEAGDIHDRFQRWLLSWAETNPIGDTKYLRRSWIPHSVSLRILNWTRYAAWCEQANLSVDDRLYHQIFKNALFLENHIEFEVGGNHLIENAIALVVAGVLFDSHETGWKEIGLDILEDAGETQFLTDGGHFERSPMYHLMVLRRFITAYQLLAHLNYPTDQLQSTIKQALGHLESISEPEGRIPLLNDAVLGEQISARACGSYAEKCGIAPQQTSLDNPKGSGYLKLTSTNSTVLVDVGDIGPRHLPAHSHNDQLSVLLWIGNSPILTDTGVYDYAPTPRRQYSRSIAAHNTAQFEDAEPIPIGGSYLMGRRATTDLHNHTSEFVRAECKKQSWIGPEYSHNREVSISNNGWKIRDRVDSEAEGHFTVRYHFSPTIGLEEVRHGVFTVSNEECILSTIQVEGYQSVEQSESPYFERYGTETMRPRISVTAKKGSEIRTCISISSQQISEDIKPTTNQSPDNCIQ
ncbi:alginate lyase family protein [Haloglomus halophilum]|uniref:alginate lyase family protein n=1 Tax=Haloglomus halophilum TaxID=2962672 RepID=UPI0020C9CD4A|nr:alginate lyase family protein [Haloglomus halophilum]